MHTILQLFKSQSLHMLLSFPGTISIHPKVGSWPNSYYFHSMLMSSSMHGVWHWTYHTVINYDIMPYVHWHDYVQLRTYTVKRLLQLIVTSYSKACMHAIYCDIKWKPSIHGIWFCHHAGRAWHMHANQCKSALVSLKSRHTLIW